MKTRLVQFADRREAGRALAEQLAPARGGDVLVLGIPRGGVLVAQQVARALGAPLDVLVTRRLRSPHDPSLVLGAVAETGAVWLNELALMHAGVKHSELSEPIMREAVAVERQARLYRQGRGRRHLEGRVVILVDDGVVSGATAQAALSAVRVLGPARLLLAVGVAEPSAAAALRGRVDGLVVAHEPAELGSLARWYGDFAPVTDGEVLATLAAARADAERALEAAVP